MAGPSRSRCDASHRQNPLHLRIFTGSSDRRHYALRMASSFTPGPLLGQTFPLAEGVDVRLRMAHFSDWPAIAELMAQGGTGAGPDARDARALVQFDPRRCCVLCACALIDSSERLVAVGAIDLTADVAGEPDVLIVDPELARITDAQVSEALTGLLSGALVGAAQAAARTRAA